jgi:hypothetical protein
MAAIGGRPARWTRASKLRVAAFNMAWGLAWWLLMGERPWCCSISAIGYGFNSVTSCRFEQG